MQTINFSITINAVVSTVWEIMLNHPTYEQWTVAFTEWSTYEWTREKDSEIKFLTPSWEGMLSKIADNKLYEYVSIKSLGEIGRDGEIKLYEGDSFENYKFSKIDDATTKLDIELTGLPEEYAQMFNEMWPKALILLKDLCEK